MSMTQVTLKPGESNANPIKIGNTVRRNPSDNSSLSHSVLQLLEKHEYPFSPKFLGIDKREREIITYIDGETLLPYQVPMDICIQAIKALRQFHDILSQSSLKGRSETICHNDFSPWNVLIKEGKLVGVIDFDSVDPGKRITDLAYACWTFIGLGSPRNGLSDEEQIKRIGILTDKYDKINTTAFVQELLSEQYRVLKYKEERTKLAISVLEKKESELKCRSILNEIDWVKRNANKIRKALQNEK